MEEGEIVFVVLDVSWCVFVEMDPGQRHLQGTGVVREGFVEALTAIFRLQVAFQGFGVAVVGHFGKKTAHTSEYRWGNFLTSSLMSVSVSRSPGVVLGQGIVEVQRLVQLDSTPR